MNIFNSLGSNYDFATALRILFSFGGDSKRRALTAYLEKRYGGRPILTYKGREALTLALSALPEKGAVAMNGFTCLAVYESIAGSDNTVRYLDIAENSLDFSFETLRNAVETENIKAVIVQNTLGNPCNIGPIAKLCVERGIVLVEDLAHSIGTRYASGEEAGTVGDFVVLSFSQDKVVDAVSGGALIVRDGRYKSKIPEPAGAVRTSQRLKDRFYPMLTWKIRFAYALGIGRPYHAFLRYLGILSRPLDESPGPRGLPGWYCGNILRQYQALERTARHRREIAKIYAQHLDKRLLLPLDLERSAHVRFPILTEQRKRLVAHLRRQGVHISDIWYDAPVAPKKYLHQTDYAGQCPHAEKASATILNLPTHINVSPADAHRIAGMVNEWLQDERKNMYKVMTVNDKGEWEGFLAKQKPHSFLQSWTWGQLNAENDAVFRLGVYKGQTLVAAGLFIKVSARRGSFLLCPHGPVFAANENETALLRLMTDESTRIARSEKCDFIRICPLAKASPQNKTVYRSLGFRDAPIHMHPELSWMLDIKKSENDLLREMRKTTRYLVKKMEKEGVKITQSNNPDDIEKFWSVYQATVERQQFTPFKKEDLRKEFELFARDGNATLFLGEQSGAIVAAAIIIFYNGQAFYHHSGSLSSGSNVSYLLQWRVIKEARKRGCTLYNFWGISPADRPNHPWAGLSLFKKGFGGFAEEYLHAQDKPLTARYVINYVVETARRIRRGL